MKSLSILLFLAFGWLLLFSACQHEPDLAIAVPPVIENNCNPDSVYFRTEILPVLVSSCGVSGCHDAGSQSEGVRITDYASIMSTAEIEPGNASKSDLYKVISRSIAELRMPPPPRPPLSAAHISKIEKWINQGALDNECVSDVCDTLDVKFSSHISPIVQNYCQGCHSGAEPSGGFGLTNYNEIALIASEGSLMGSIRHENAYSAMPKDSDKLSDCQIRQFELWIAAGMPAN